ncbi:MAG: hypothetical protein K2N45_00285 [Helicobacter japonicus]|nr:hypothetical protein [Helicobacter japonicus]
MGASFGNIDLGGNAAATANGQASIGDNSYIVDSSTQLDFGGANIDTSTTIGLQGNEIASLTNMMQNAIGAVAEVSNQSARVANNVATKESEVGSFLRQYGLYVIGGIAGIVVLLNWSKIKKGF